MWLTEEEAKKKWCPMSRGENGRNRMTEEPHKDSFCIASKCMAWKMLEFGEKIRRGYCVLMQPK